MLLILILASPLNFIKVSFADDDSDAAVTSSCDCLPNDPMAKKTCGPEPVKLKKDVFAADVCVNCETQKTNEAVNASVMGEESSELLLTPSNVKTPKEVLNYISCYRSSDKRFCHYKTTLAPHIALAAESAGLPMAVQSCLFLREAGFNPEAKSAVGALGYVQFMPNTINSLKSIVSGNVLSWQKSIEETEAKILAVDEKLKTEKIKSQITLLKKNKNYYQAIIMVWKAKISAKNAWHQYWEGTPNPPAKVSNENLKCPQIAFALAAVKQKYDLGLIQDFKSEVIAKNNNTFGLSINGLNERDSAILLAGGYNAGIGGIASKCGSVKTLDECLKNFPTGHETRNYMSSIRSCSAKNSTDPMTGNLKKDCEVSKCK